MKHSIKLLAIILLCVASYAQPKNKAVIALEKGAKESNEGLPKDVAAFLRMDMIEIKGNDYIVYATFDENQMNFDDYLKTMNDNKLGVFSMIAHSSKDYAELFVESGLNLKYVITGKHSKRKGEFFMSADEIKQAMNADFSIRDYMAQLVKSM